MRLVIIIKGYCFSVWVLREMMILRAGYSRLALEERFGDFWMRALSVVAHWRTEQAERMR